MRIDGHFTDRNGDRIDVAIYNMYVTANNINIDTSSNIRFAEEPVIIETDCDDSFVHVIKTKCKISLTTKIWLGDYLFANNAESIVVNVHRTHNNVKTCIFCGFVTPCSFNQDYAHEWETVEINCIDYLSVLEYKYPTDDMTYEELRANVTSRPFIYFLDKMRLNNTQMIIPNLPTTQNESIWVETDYTYNDNTFTAIESELQILDVTSAVNTGNTRLGSDKTPTWVQSAETTIGTDGLIYYKEYAYVDINGVSTKTDVWRQGEAAEMPYVVDTVNTFIGYVRANRFEYYDYYRVDFVMNTGAIIEGSGDAVGDLIPEYPNTTSEGSYYEMRQGDAADADIDATTGNAYYKNYAWVVQTIDGETVETKTNDWERGTQRHAVYGTLTNDYVNQDIGLIRLYDSNVGHINIDPAIDADERFYIFDLPADMSNVYMMQVYNNVGSYYNTMIWTNVDTSHITYLGNRNGAGATFSGLSNLVSLDISCFDTSNVQTFEQLFNGCSSLTTLDISNFDTSSASNMNDMFNGCNSLQELTISSTFYECDNMSGLFAFCNNLAKIINIDNIYSSNDPVDLCDLSNFDLSIGTSTNSMFAGCSNIKYLALDLSSAVLYNADSMFTGCNNMKLYDLNNHTIINNIYIDTISNSIRNMFTQSGSVTYEWYWNSLTIDTLSDFSTDYHNVEDIFGNCNKRLYINNITDNASEVTDNIFNYGGLSTSYTVTIQGTDYIYNDNTEQWEAQ